MKKILILLFILLPYFKAAYTYPLMTINYDSALRIGIKIWYNECNGKISGLTSWNEGEKFASLGIGHFNWYPNNHLGSTQDGFPQLIRYMERCGITVPNWLQGENIPPCPWHTRNEFLAAQKSQKMVELRQFLIDTIPLQAQFMAYRLTSALPKLITKAPYGDKAFIFRQFTTFSSTPQGLYILIDYVNFKGEGTSSKGKTTGWGLLQVVQGMKFAPYTLDPIQAFVWSANQVLTERVRRASPTSHEQKWLVGWRKRLSTYLES